MNEYTNKEINFIINNYNNLSAREIAKQLERPLSSVQSKIIEIGLSKTGCPHCAWSNEEIDYLKDNFFNCSLAELASHLNRTTHAIRVKASKLGLKNPRKYYLNETRFERISTEQDAYWLGFLYADGYVCISNPKDGNPSYWMGIELQIKDREHLVKLNKYMESNTQIKEFEAKSPCSNNYYVQCSLSYYCKHLVESLIDKGCVQRKSKIITFPFDKMDKELYRHFIRGYFDGDGSVGKYIYQKKYQRVRASIACGSKDFLNSIKDILLSENITAGVYLDNTCYKLSIGSQECTKKFLDYIYKDSTIYLTRKYNKYLYSYNMPN